MTRSLLLASLRYLRRHPWQSVLSLVGIALGVAVVVAVDIANESAQRAFAWSMEGITGKATHHIVGGPTGVDEGLYTRLRVDAGLRATAPIVEGFVDLHGETFQLLGVDPYAEGAFREHVGGLEGDHLQRLLLDPNTVALPRISAERLGIALGDRLQLSIAGRERTVEVVGLVVGDTQREAALDGLLFADIATAQELLDRLGRLDRIDLVLAERAAADQVATLLPPGVELQEAAMRTQGTQQLTRAFHINLTAMSLLALLVGGFLIYNTMTFSVLQRRSLIGTLRTLGVTRAAIFGLVCLEAALIGLLGTGAGLPLGLLLGEGLLELVTRTINDLYFVLTVKGLILSPMVFLKAVSLGVGASLLAALGPAIEAARASPLAAQRRSVIERRVHRAAPWLTAAGLLLIGTGLLIARWPSRSLVLGFLGLFVLAVGFSLLTPLAVLLFSRLVTPGLKRALGGIGGLAARALDAGLSRTGVAIAALSIAVSASVGVGVMIHSFRAAVVDWLDQTLQGDIYVAAPADVSSRASAALGPQVLARLRALHGIRDISTGRSVTVESPRGPIELLVLAPAKESHRGFALTAGSAAQTWSGFRQAQGLLASEPLAYRLQIGVGDEITLLTDRGPASFPVLGIFRDYGSSQGMLVLSRALYETWWDDRIISSLGIYARADQPLDELLLRIRRAVAGVDQGAVVRSNREIRELSLEIFDRTFAITHVLRLLVIAVAFVGVLSALMALQLERAKEHAVLRATGVTPVQLWAMISLQTTLMGIAAGALAIPLGLMMSELLIDVINLRSFGWSMPMRIPHAALLEALGLTLTAALLAGLYPSLRMARVPPAAALREE